MRKFLLIFMIFTFMMPSILFSTGKKKNELQFAYYEDSISYRVATEILKEAYSRIGWEINIIQIDYTNRFKYADKIHFDGDLIRVNGIEKIKENLCKVDIPVTYIMVTVLSINKPLPLPSNWNSLKKYKVGVIKDAAFVSTARKSLKGVVEMHNFDGLVELLIQKKIDAVVIPRAEAKEFQNKYPNAHLKISPQTLEVILLYHYLNKSHKQLIPALEEVLRKMANNGTSMKIRKRVLKSLGEKKNDTKK